MAGSKVNPRHEKFIQGILEGKSQTRAYIDAGYSAKNARHSAARLLTNDNISERLAKLREERRASWADRLDDIAEQALEMLPIMIKLGTKEQAPRVAAINLALKYAGLEPVKKLEHSGEVNHKIKVEFVGIPDGYFNSRDDARDDDQENTA